jgi:hypothetical protein
LCQKAISITILVEADSVVAKKKISQKSKIKKHPKTQAGVLAELMSLQVQPRWRAQAICRANMFHHSSASWQNHID